MLRQLSLWESQLDHRFQQQSRKYMFGITTPHQSQSMPSPGKLHHTDRPHQLSKRQSNSSLVMAWRISSHSFATNLDATSNEIVDAIRFAQSNQRHVICFVTGIPGAGKTLAGLNAVHDPKVRESGRPAAAFLSGNGPLVKVVREAIVRDRKRAGMPALEAMRASGPSSGTCMGSSSNTE